MLCGQPPSAVGCPLHRTCNRTPFNFRNLTANAFSTVRIDRKTTNKISMKNRKSKSVYWRASYVAARQPKIIIIILIVIPVPKSTTDTQIQRFKTAIICPRSIAGMLFDSVRRFRASLSLNTTSISVCLPDVIGVFAAWRHNKQKRKNVYGCVFCSISFLFVYMCVRMSSSPR